MFRELNPSDMGSRGAKLSEIRNNPFYWDGPEFLLQTEEHWPDILRCQMMLQCPLKLNLS